jgi:ferricrocin synthase
VFALELQYDASSGHTILSSASCVPESFQQEILTQIQQLIVDRIPPDDGVRFPADRGPLLSIVQPQRKVLPGPQLLHRLMSSASSAATAIDFLSGDKKRVQLSYQDLDRLSDRLAATIASALSQRYDEPTKDRIVPVLIPQTPELYIAQIAILKSGASFCPLDVDVPAERLVFIVKDVAAKVVITIQACKQRFSELELELKLDIISSIIDEDDEYQVTNPCTSGSDNTQQHPESLAYVMYTSGSTGVPKGVAVSHLAVTQALLAHEEHVPQFQRFLQFAAPTFDVSVFEIFFTLYRGGTLVCCNRADMLDDLHGVMNELNVDAAELTPSVAGTLLRSWDAVPSLRLLLTIGEMLPRSVVEHFPDSQCPERRMVPMYGPTEASIHCIVAAGIGNEAKAGIIGRPLSTVSAFVVAENRNDNMNILPVGHIGELAIAGQLAEGYVNRLEQTQAAFVDLPGYGPIYRTGDRVRLLPSGDLECLGRIASSQVKIRGQRVELGEIEQVICRVNNVRLAVASIIDGNLVVFCLLDDGRLLSASKQAIQEECKAWLPSFMRPTDIVLSTQALPRLASGKIDKPELERLYHTQPFRAQSDTDHFANDLESCIAEVIRNELGLHVARCDDLWSKGLNSLRSIRLASRLRDRGIDVAATDILSADTIATLSETLQQRPQSNPTRAESANNEADPFQDMKDTVMSELHTARHPDIDDIVPCSKLQSAMLFESLVSDHVNFNFVKIEIAKPVCVTDFVKAFCRLAQLNGILRSGFVHLPEQDSRFARIIWTKFHADEQIRYEEFGLSGKYSQEEAADVTLLRPLRLGIAASESHAIVSIYLHHALYDGWSWDLIMADLDSLIAGNQPPARPQFQEFVQYEGEFLSSEKATAAQEYWADHLRGVKPGGLPVLTNKKCKAETHNFHRASGLDLSLLDAVSRHLRISRHSIPSAAFATLLSLYCGLSEAVFGSVSSGRTLSIPGIENMIGPCISTLPVRINFDHLRTVGDLLLHTHRLHLNFLHFGQLPLRDIKKAAHITAAQTLFDALFVWQETSETKKSARSGLSVIDGTDSLQYALILEIEPRGHQLSLKATYNTSSLCAEQVETFIGQFEAIVAFYTRSPNMPWKEVLDHVQPRDLSIANPNFSTVDPSITLFFTIDRISQHDPTRVAIEFVDDFDPVLAAMKVSKLSYGELAQKSGVLSRFLVSRGIVANELVCLFMHKSIQLYIAILGVLKAGAAYLVIDPQAPPERTRRILDCARCRYCLTNGDLQDHRVLSKVERVLFYSKIEEAMQSEVSMPAVADQSLAYAVFTSGSTGIPKGVLITRRNILSNIDVLSQMYPSVAEGALLQACSLAFDGERAQYIIRKHLLTFSVSVFEILYTWHTGMRLCAASNDVLFRDIEHFIQLLHITHLSLTPSVASLIRPIKVPQVQMLVVAGEAVTSKVFRDWSGRGLYQGYGPSETTNICSVHPQVSISDHINDIGRPLPNTSMFISSSEEFRPLPKGALGEIWIGGDQVGRGYLESVNLTAKRFIEHPQHGMLYRSGDLGRMLPSGNVLFDGRQDDQIKLRGQRIELGEIEHVLVELPTVLDSVCLLIENSEQAQCRLVAYWSSTRSLDTDSTHYVKPVFEEMQSRLPPYMIPDYLIHVDAVPLTSQGKTDRKALKHLFLEMEPAALNKFSRQETSAREGGLKHQKEIEVAQALAEVTGTPLSIITRDISFFALGLDSISCISLSRKLLELGLGQVDVSLILRHASIAKLLSALTATPIDGSLDQGNKARLHHIFDEKWQERVKLKYARSGLHVQRILPCTPLQEAMLSQAESSRKDAYRNRLTFSVHGDLHQLEAAWTACVAAHGILRTGFVLTNSPQFPYAQVVLASYGWPWDKKNHSIRAETAEEQFLMPPYSFEIDERSDTLPPRLILNIHHALYDGQAVSLLLRDVERAYRHTPIDTATSFEPYLEYMVSVEEGDAFEFWRAHLADYCPKVLPKPSQACISDSSPKEYIYQVSSNLALQALLDSSKRSSVTILSLLQLTWARLLAHYSRDSDTCFGNVYGGRNLPICDVEEIDGPCFNTLPVRTSLGKYDTNQQVARRLQDHNLAALRFQPFSLRLIQRSQGVSRLFDTLLLLQAEPAELDSSIWTLEEDHGDMNFPLILEIVPHSKSNQLVFLLHVEQYSSLNDRAEALLTDFDLLLQHTIQYPDALAIDCSMLGENRPILLNPLSAPAGTDRSSNPSEALCSEEWSVLEEYICDVLRKVSEKDITGLTRHTTIFHLGFDSINAIQIAAELRRGGFRVRSGDVLEAATVPGIASLCETQAPKGPDHDRTFDLDDFSKKHLMAVCGQLSMDPRTIEEVRPCTSFQSGILADFVRSQGEYYLNGVHYELDQDINVGLLKTAWDIVSSRHDILRTGFVEIDGPQHPFAMILYCRGTCALPWSEIKARHHDIHGEHGRSLLNLLHQPPWRLTIIDQGVHSTMHLSILHALFDARTLGLLLDEVAVAYRGGELPRVVPIKPCLSRILHESSTQPIDEGSVSYNAKTMPPTLFPNLHSHHVEDQNFQTMEYDCSRSLIEIQANCREASVTLQVAGQCAWARLLSAYTGETVNTFGVVLSGRSGENDEEAVLFPCINTVPVSMNVESNTNQTLLKSAATLTAKRMNNPFSPVKGWSGSQGELFDSLFVLQHPMPATAMPPWRLLAEDARATYTVSLELLAKCDDDKLRIRLTCRKQVVPVEQGWLIVKQFSALLVDTLDHLYEDASQLIHIDKRLFSTAPAKDPMIETSVKYLHQFVEINALKLPNKTAFEFAFGIVDEKVTKISWTYAALDASSNKLAHMLQRNGAIPGDLIGICFGKCLEASLAILGILKAGCAYVALDPNAPEARRKFILEDSGCSILCTTQEHADSLALVDGLQILRVDKVLEGNDLPSTPVNLSRKLVADDICYCLYTSGTTGTPKGCLITHDNAVQFVLAFQRLFAGSWNADSRFLQFASFHFDVSVMEQYWSWSVGICVTSAPRDLLFEDLSAAIRALQITHIDLTPSLASLLKPEECPSLCGGAFITGGEQLRQDIIDAWGEESVIYNGYGPSEVTIGCTMYPRVPRSAKPSNIGPAYDNVGAYVLDLHTKRPVLRGGVGELCVSGPLVGKGYLNRPELTAEKFAFLDHLGVRVYHTGDLVRLLYDGSYCFIGRADDQVKLRGQRLEIGEIDHVVRQTSTQIKGVATMVLKHREGSKEQLVTFIAMSESRAGAINSPICLDSSPLGLTSSVRKACNNALPAYMVPSHIIPINFMSLSANNKVDNKALKYLFQATSAAQLQRLSASRFAKQDINHVAMKKVIQVVSQVVTLSEDSVQASSGLFELGIDSISVISLSRLLRTAGFAAATPSTIMRNSVVADLVTALTEPTQVSDNDEAARQDATRDIAAFERKHRLAIAGVLGISGHDIEMIAPCTPLQQGMIVRVLGSDDSAYLSSFTFDLDSSLDLARLEAAWVYVEQQNEILRTRFVLTHDGYAQVVLKSPTPPEVRVQRQEIDQEQDIKIVLKRKFERWAECVRNLENSPWNVTLYHTTDNVLMVLHIFHGLYDGISLSLMLEEVACNYKDISSPTPKSKYHDVLPLGPLLSPAGAQEFWTKRLHLRNLLNLPLQHGRNGVFEVSSSIAPCSNVKKLQHRFDVTESSIFHACWLMALEKEFGILPTIGVVVSGRALDVDGVENLVGPLFNTIPYHVNVRNLSTIADLVKACHSLNVETLPYQHTPLSKISKWLRCKSTEPLFDSLFVYQKEAKNAGELHKLWTQIDSSSQPDYPLALEVAQRSEGSWTCTVVAQGQHLNHEQVRTLSNTLKETLDILLKDPLRSLLLMNVGHFRSSSATVGESQSAKVVRSNQVLNGTATSKSDFQWDIKSKSMRAEIANLSASPISDVTPYTSIFELGLDSIDAIKLAARFKEANVFIPVSSILKAGSIAEMTESIATQVGHSNHTAHTSFDQLVQDLRRSLKNQGVPVNDYEKVLPVTPLQESMLANYQQYYSQDVLRISEGIDIERLISSWRAAVFTHDILRTTFLVVDDPNSPSIYAQLVSKDVEIEVNTMILTGENELQSLLSRQREEARRTGIDQPPLHFTLVNVGSATFLVLGMPHAVYDGWSIGLLHEDVARCYDGLPCDRPSYESILAHIVSTVSETSRSFWEDMLSVAHPIPFPAHQDELPAYSTIHSCEITSKVPLQQVIAFCRAESSTLQSLGLTCWTIVLAHYSRSREVCFGVVLAGRDIENADEVMFPTMNTVVFRMMLGKTKEQMVKDAHKLSMAISEHQHFPLRQTKSLVKDAGGQLFDTLFIYQKKPSSKEQLPPLYQSVTGLSEPEYPVNVEMELHDDQLIWRAACKSSVLDVHGTQLLLCRLDGVLRSILEAPTEPVFSPSIDGISICRMPTFNNWSDEPESREFLSFSALSEDQEDQTELLPDEEIIVQVLAAIANIERAEITRSTSLFHLGLDSISAIKVSSALKKRSISLTVSEMMESLTVQGMAKASKPIKSVSDQKNSFHGPNTMQSLDQERIRNSLQRAGIGEDLVERTLSCTAGQEFFLGVWRASGGRLFYPEFHYRVQGVRATRQIVDTAWQRLVQAVPMLRTIFLAEGGPQKSTLQVILKNTTDQVRWVTEFEDDSGISDEVLQRPDRPPVMLLAREAATNMLLKLRIHHALYDGVSLTRMMNAFESLCSSQAFPDQLESQFQSHLSFLQSATNKEQQKAFWMSYLDGSTPAQELRISSFEAERVQVFRPRLIDDLSLIERKLRKNGISFQAFFFEAYARVHARLVSTSTSASEDIAELVMGVYLANRSHDSEGLAALLAPTVNVVPLRLHVRPASSIFESARVVQDDLSRIGSIENCIVSLSEVYDWTGVKIDCFVNFLRLPDIERAPELLDSDSTVRVEEVSPQHHIGNETKTEEPPSPIVNDLPPRDDGIYLVSHSFPWKVPA